MSNEVVWTFPVPSNCIYSTVRLLHEKTRINLAFDYYDEEDDDKVYNGFIEFVGVGNYRHSTEKFTRFVKGTYDNLCVVRDSEFLKTISMISPEWFDEFNMKHYAIYLDSYGLYEIVASSFEVSELKRGSLDGQL